MDFEVAKIISKTPVHDITGGFVDSVMGNYTMKRLGINTSMIDRQCNQFKCSIVDYFPTLQHTKD